jgi:myosin heavy subunit
MDSSVDNLIRLNDLTEAAILHNLRLRFKEDKIYTNISSILISVNPFKLLPLYTPAVLDRYKDQGSRGLPPHVFAVADAAYKQMLSDDQSQSCVISGESGAGKTEATKLILQFLTEVSGRSESKSGANDLEGKILGCNPILEAFGNSKTLRNNNSSRFGKLISVKFNSAGTITGGAITSYLLEKVRVVKQTPGERNYHIFYQLLASDLELKKAMQLDATEAVDHAYLNQSGITSIPGLSDEKEMQDMVNAMEVMGIDKQAQKLVFQATAGVLCLGNIEFVVDAKATEEDGARIKNTESLQRAATLFGVPLEKLQKSMLTRKVGFDCVVCYNVLQAADARGALAKTIYSKIFDRLVGNINDALAADDGADEMDALMAHTNAINVLDIFGFETFDTNSFEQLSINYCNEKLQSHFNQHIFKLEEDEYKREGIEVANADFADNQPCLDLLEKERTGVFDLLDDEIYVPRGSDEGFLNKVLQIKHPNLKRPKPKEKDSRVCFNILHFAGEVSYNTRDFLQKNKDSLHEDIQKVFAEAAADIVGVGGADTPLVLQLMRPTEESEEKAGRGGPKRRGSMKNRHPTLGAQFKRQLSELLDTLNETDPHFVRCLKSNAEKKGDKFTASMVLDQMRYAGLVEVCRIRQVGYPLRKDFDAFFRRYSCLANDESSQPKSFDELVEALVAKKMLLKGQWAKGKAKIFLKNQQATDLEAHREERLLGNVLVLQGQLRSMLSRNKHDGIASSLKQLSQALAKRDATLIEESLNQVAASGLPNSANHLPTVQEAKKALVRLSEEVRVGKMVAEAIESQDLNDLHAALALAENMTPKMTGEVVTRAKAMAENLQQVKQLRADLQNAMFERNGQKIKDLLEQCKSFKDMGLEKEIQQAQELYSKLAQEDKVVADLQAAMTKASADGDLEARRESLEQLDACMKQMSSAGLENRPQYHEAKALKEKLSQAIHVERAVQDAAAKRELVALNEALASADKLGITSTLITEARSLVRQVEKEQKVVDALQAAIDSGDLKKLEVAIKEGGSIGLAVSSGAGYRIYNSAVELQQSLQKQGECKEALVKATKKKQGDKLANLLVEASRLGLSGTEVDKARAVVEKLGASSSIVQALASGDSALIEKALAAAEQRGAGQSKEAEQAREAIARLKEEKEVLFRLEEGVKTSNIQMLKHGVGSCMGMGLSQKYSKEVAAAKSMIDKLSVRMKVELQLTGALKSGDMEAIGEALVKATAEGVDSEEVQAAIVLQKASRALDNALENAGSGPEVLQTAIDESMKACDGLSEKLAALVKNKLQEKVKHLESASDREALRTKLQTATQNQDREALQNILQQAIECGLTGEEVSAAKRRYDELGETSDTVGLLTSTMKTIEITCNNPLGLSAGDWQPLEDSITAARKAGLSDSHPEMAKAIAQVESMRKQVEATQTIAAASKARDYKQLRSAVREAQDLLMKTDAVEQAKELLMELYGDRQRLRQAGELTDDGADDEDDGDENLILEEASDSRYSMENYKNLRSLNDFTKGAPLRGSLQEVKENMLKWQKQPLHKSLINVGDGPDRNHPNKQAVVIHKNILGYMGDRYCNSSVYCTVLTQCATWGSGTALVLTILYTIHYTLYTVLIHGGQAHGFPCCSRSRFADQRHANLAV